MNVKLIQGMAGDGCAPAGNFLPRQVIKCSERQGARFISEGVAVEADPKAEVEGEFLDHAPEEKAAPARKPALEKAVGRKPETPEGQEGAAICRGKTAAGFACKKAALPGKRFCAKHKE